MKFTERHKEHLVNALSIMKRCTLPDVQNGEEYLAFAQTYFFLVDLTNRIDQEIQADKAMQQALVKQSTQVSNAISTEPVKNGLVAPKESKPRKNTKELAQRVE